MEHLSNDHGDHPNQHENSHKLCNETGHSVLGLMESQRKLRQQHERNTSIRRKKEIQKTRTVRIIVMDPSSKVNHMIKAS